MCRSLSLVAAFFRHFDIKIVKRFHLPQTSLYDVSCSTRLRPISTFIRGYTSIFCLGSRGQRHGRVPACPASSISAMVGLKVQYANMVVSFSNFIYLPGWLGDPQSTNNLEIVTGLITTTPTSVPADVQAPQFSGGFLSSFLHLDR